MFTSMPVSFMKSSIFYAIYSDLIKKYPDFVVFDVKSTNDSK